ncbi:MAG TPA: winged helix-turn-helix domain-containing protein [Vicinamibacteria bacterium]|nr:winged helix-turn-helix domain-containing protein [Vicinamibacteria bacterium]
MEKLSAAKSGDATPLKARRLRFGRFVFDAENALLTRDGEDVALPPRAAEVLKHLLTHPGEVVPKEALLDAAWNGVAVSEHSLSEAIKVLRRALQDDPREPRFVQTLHRRGFRFLAPVEVDREGPRPAPAPERRRSARLSWVLALSASSLAIAAYFGVRTRGPVELPPAELVARGSEPDSGSLSPDGRMLAFTSWAGGIVVRDLLSGEDTLLDEHGGLVECPPVWSPEGSRLAYGFSENHRWQVRLIDRKVRAPSVVYQTERGLAVTDWSPDGRRLLLVQFPTETNLKASLGELSLEDGSFREMRSFEWVWPPRAFYSPDGSRIAYGSSDGDRGTVHVFDREGGIDVAITHEQSDEGFPLWSPNGRFLLLRSRSDDDWDFWAVALRGLERVGGPYLVQDRAGDSYPWSWAKEGSLLSIQKSQWGEIWTLPLEPSTVEVAAEPSRFSEQLAESVNHGVPSPSGDRVVVSVTTESGSRRFFLVSRSEARLLPLPPDSHLRMVIGWAPDESWVLLWGRSPEGEDLFVRFYPQEGATRPVQIDSGPPLMGFFAALSPDGRRMVLEEEDDECDRNLVLVSLETGKRSRLDVSGCRLMSAWSPDGREIAVAGNLPEQRSEVLVLPLAGARRRTLASWRDLDFGKLGPLTWSPDGKSIVFVLHPPGMNELYVLPAEGGEPRLLYRPKRVDPWKPYWPREDSGIFFTAMRIESRFWRRRDVVARLEGR